MSFIRMVFFPFAVSLSSMIAVFPSNWSLVRVTGEKYRPGSFWGRFKKRLIGSERNWKEDLFGFGKP